MKINLNIIREKGFSVEVDNDSLYIEPKGGNAQVCSDMLTFLKRLNTIPNDRIDALVDRIFTEIEFEQLMGVIKDASH